MAGPDLDQELSRDAALLKNSKDVVDLDNSEIRRFFSGTSVFITGATGFLGKVLIEKLLRSCNNINKIYVLIRPKKGIDIGTRIQEQFNDPLYDVLKKQNPNFFGKIVPLEGDIGSTDLGLSSKDRETLINEVGVVFHVAATVRFDEKIKTAVAINIRGTRDLLRLAREMRELKSVVHISTAYSNCVLRNIDEKFYDSPIPWEKLVDMAETLDDELLNRMTPAMLGDYPNTYAYTKAVSESVVKDLSKGLPVAMLRPAIVISTAKEPIIGWIDNVYGPTGVVFGAALGLIHTLHADKNVVADMIPVDYVVNAIIATAWYTGSHKENYEDIKERAEGQIGNEADEIPVYNYVSSEQSPITWGEFMKFNERYGPLYASEKIVWSYCFTLNKFKLLHLMYVFFLHTVPAHIVDAVLYCMGKKPMLIKGYQKINKFSAVISYFSTQRWKFSNQNTQKLFTQLNQTDKELFEFDMSTVHWETFFQSYLRGMRLYLAKDPLETIPQGTKKMQKLKILHNLLCIILSLLLLRVLWGIGLFIYSYV